MTTSRNRSPIALIAGLVAVAVIAAVGYSLLSGDDDGSSSALVEEYRPVIVEGDPLPRVQGQAAAVGMQAPTFTAQSFAGEEISIDYDGTTGRIIGFFAHWCPHCQAEVPEVSDWLADTTLPQGVEVLAVSTSAQRDEDNFPPSEWFDKEDWPDPVIADDEAGTLGGYFGLTAFPYWIAIDADGVVVDQRTGQQGIPSLQALLSAVAPRDS